MYNTADGKFFFTGSYSGGGSVVQYGDISGIPANIVSSSVLTSTSQGTVTQSINGVITNVDLGLETTDTAIFGGIIVSGDAQFGQDTNDTVTIAGDLKVHGNTTSISTINLQIEDTFILLASGSAGDGSLNDGGIIVEQTAAGKGVALYWDTSEKNWSIDIADADHTNATGGVTADVNVVTVQLNANSGVAPTSSPIMGVDGNTNERGHFYVDTSDEFGLYVYT